MDESPKADRQNDAIIDSVLSLLRFFFAVVGITWLIGFGLRTLGVFDCPADDYYPCHPRPLHLWPVVKAVFSLGAAWAWIRKWIEAYELKEEANSLQQRLKEEVDYRLRRLGQ
jgi:hypothetical protein